MRGARQQRISEAVVNGKSMTKVVRAECATQALDLKAKLVAEGTSVHEPPQNTSPAITDALSTALLNVT